MTVRPGSAAARRRGPGRRHSGHRGPAAHADGGRRAGGHFRARLRGHAHRRRGPASRGQPGPGHLLLQDQGPAAHRGHPALRGVVVRGRPAAMEELPTAAARIEEIVAMNCLNEADPSPGSSWQLWLDFWAQAARNTRSATCGASRTSAGASRSSRSCWRAGGRRVPRRGADGVRDLPVEPAGRADHPDRAGGPGRRLDRGVRDDDAVRGLRLGFSWDADRLQGGPRPRGAD